MNVYAALMRKGARTAAAPWRASGDFKKLRAANGLWVAWLAVLALGCGGPADGSTRFSEIEQDVFLLQGCIACHPDGTTDLTLQKGRAYSALVGKRVNSPYWDGTPWAGWLLVDPGSPETSALLIAMERPDELPFALRMPPDGIVPEEDIARVRNWIAAGAHNN